jgi:pseudouridine kinase
MLRSGHSIIQLTAQYAILQYKKCNLKKDAIILFENNTVVVVGGAAVDIQGAPQHPLALKDSNPGKIQLSLGGVARNIAENCVRLGVPVQMLTAVGDDLFGDLIKRHSILLGIGIEHALFLKETHSATFMAVNDVDGDLALAIADMEITQKVDPAYLQSKQTVLKKARAILVETNLSQEALEYIVHHHGTTPIFCDAVSVIKAKKIHHLVGHFHTIKPNQYEAEYLSGVSIRGADGLNRAMDYFLHNGVQQVFITLGKKGAFYGNAFERGFIPAPRQRPLNTLGAGDAFLAACIEGFIHSRSILETAQQAMLAAYLTLQHTFTASPELSINSIQALKGQFPLHPSVEIPDLTC